MYTGSIKKRVKMYTPSIRNVYWEYKKQVENIYSQYTTVYTFSIRMCILTYIHYQPLKSFYFLSSYIPPKAVILTPFLGGNFEACQ